MRKSVLTVLAVLSLTAGAIYAQSANQTQAAPVVVQSKTGVLTNGKIAVKNVRITHQGVVITADEALYDEASREYELVGHVRVQLAPAQKP